MRPARGGELGYIAQVDRLLENTRCYLIADAHGHTLTAPIRAAVSRDGIRALGAAQIFKELLRRVAEDQSVHALGSISGGIDNRIWLRNVAPMAVNEKSFARFER